MGQGAVVTGPTAIMEQPSLNWIADFIWNIADDVLRDLRAWASYPQLRADILALERETHGLRTEIIGMVAR